MARERDPGLHKIRGWLLLFTILLVPHAVGSLALLLRQLQTGTLNSGPALLGAVTLGVTAVGNFTGLALILRRSPTAPAYFTLYLPLLVVLFFLDPDPVATINARLTSLGSPGPVTAVQLGVLIVVNLVLVVLSVAYWSKSMRVEAVFGSRGLSLLRRTHAPG